MKSYIFNLFLFCLYISLSPVECYKKCCPPGNHLDASRKYCVENTSGETIETLVTKPQFNCPDPETRFDTDKILCIKDRFVHRLVCDVYYECKYNFERGFYYHEIETAPVFSHYLQINSTQNGVGFPENCEQLESLLFNKLFVVSKSTGKDMLSTSKYKDPIYEENFCIDTFDGDIYAITCNQCVGKLCINLCCPFGYKLKGNEYSNMILNAIIRKYSIYNYENKMSNTTAYDYYDDQVHKMMNTTAYDYYDNHVHQMMKRKADGFDDYSEDKISNTTEYDYYEYIKDKMNTTRLGFAHFAKEEYGSDSFTYYCEPIDTTKTQINYQLNFTNGDDSASNFKLGVDYILVGPLKTPYHYQSNEVMFECPIAQTPIDHIIKDPPHWDSSEEESWDLDRELSISTEGVASGLFKERNGHPPKYIDVPSNSFCVSFKHEFDKLTHQVLRDQELKVSFNNCKFEVQNNTCENIRWTVFNIGFFVSVFFIIAALIVHLIEPQLRDSTFGKISMMYLSNLLLQFIMILIDRYTVSEYGTICVIIGYLLQYFNLSFFCWVSAMAIFYFYGLKELRPKPSSGSKKMFYGLCFYAQGFPLLICCITATVELVKKYKEKLLDDLVESAFEQNIVKDEEYFTYASSLRMDENFLPDMCVSVRFMGVYGSYIWDKSKISYFSTSEFLYIQMYQLLILIINFGMFINTAIYILKTRRHVRSVCEAYHKENFFILVKLFFYMLFVWVLDIITAAIATNGINETCALRFVLDFPKAFYGLIIFLVMVCSKPPIRKSLVRKIKEFFTRGRSTRIIDICNIEAMNIPDRNLNGIDNMAAERNLDDADDNAVDNIADNMNCANNMAAERNLDSADNLATDRNLNGGENMIADRNLNGADNMIADRNLDSSENITSDRNMNGTDNITIHRNLNGADNFDANRNLDNSDNITANLNLESVGNMTAVGKLIGADNFAADNFAADKKLNCVDNLTADRNLNGVDKIIMAADKNLEGADNFAADRNLNSC